MNTMTREERRAWKQAGRADFEARWGITVEEAHRRASDEARRRYWARVLDGVPLDSAKRAHIRMAKRVDRLIRRCPAKLSRSEAAHELRYYGTWDRFDYLAARGEGHVTWCIAQLARFQLVSAEAVFGFLTQAGMSRALLGTDGPRFVAEGEVPSSWRGRDLGEAIDRILMARDAPRS